MDLQKTMWAKDWPYAIFTRLKPGIDPLGPENKLLLLPALSPVQVFPAPVNCLLLPNRPQQVPSVTVLSEAIPLTP